MAAPVISTTTLPTAFLNASYSTSLAATGGTPPYTWSITAGALPAGVTLSTAGVISGTPGPKTAGVYNITAQVTDTVPASGTKALTLSVNSVILVKCGACGFVTKTTHMKIANLLAAKHQAGWGPTHVVSLS
jgi:hypothetical protein